jgi:Uma2 family endonuclease
MVHLRQSSPLPTTQAAEGLPRRAWTIDEIEAMVVAGIIDPDERFELIGGEIVPMSPKGNWHENVRRVLARHWYKALPPEIDLLPETTLRISPTEFREPDFVFWPSRIAVADLRPEHVLLLVEIADSSLDYDMGRKARYYATLGIRDYWVVDARRLVTRIHRDPGSEGFSISTDAPGHSTLTPLLLPDLAVCLSALGLSPMTG